MSQFTANPTPSAGVLTGNPTPSSFGQPTTHTFQPTPTFFNSITYQPTPSNFIVPTPTRSPTMDPLVEVMDDMFSWWNLDAAATWTLVITFFVVVIAILSVLIWWCLYGPKPKVELSMPSLPSLHTSTTSPLSGSSNGPGELYESAPLLPSKDTNSYVSKMKQLVAGGMLVQLHTSKGPKQVKLMVLGSEIRWETIAAPGMPSKKYKLDLSEVLFVDWGKKTKNLVKASVDEDLCFSLVSQTSTLDLQVNTKEERDIMALGFTELIEAIKSGSAMV